MMSNPFTEGSWESAALKAANTLTGLARYEAHTMEQLWEFAYVTDDDLEWPICYLATSAFVKYRDTCNKFPGVIGMVKKLAQKQHDYGPLNITKFGNEGLKIRTWDKIARINNLEGKGSDGTVEPLSDAYFDIWGYCVLHRMLRDGTFTLPLEAELTVSTETDNNIVRYGDVVIFEWNNAAQGYTVKRA
jgi:hypothetical protein